MQTSQPTAPRPSAPSELNTLDAAATPQSASNRPGERAHDWAEPGEEPILDAARVPLQAFRDHRPAYKAYAMYAWLHILRPVLLVAFWVGVILYAWRHFFQTTDEARDVSLLGLYALIVAGIFVVMLLIAPIRHFIRKDEERGKVPADSTAFDMADYAELPSRRLFSWRRARSLVVRHDRTGKLSDAADMDAQRAATDPVAHQR